MKYIPYKYLVQPVIDDGKVEGYMAIIPAFKNSVVFGDTLEELREGIEFSIETTIENLKKKNLPVPEPEVSNEASGKLMLRIDPGLHFHLTIEAEANKMSLNKYIEKALRERNSAS